MENPTPTFSEGMQQAMSSEPIISEVERIQKRVANSRILLTPNTAQAVLATVELALQKGLFKIADMDAVITIREEIQKGIIDHNTTVAMAQKQLEEAQIKDAAILQKQLADEREKERQQLIDERSLRKRTQDRLAQMESAMLKAGISMDLNGDGIIGLTAGQVETALTQDEQVQVAELLSTTPPAPVLEPVVPVASSAMRLARSLNPVGVEQPIVPLDTPQSHTVIPSPVEMNKPISENREFVEQIESAKKSFAEFVEFQGEVLEPIPEDANTSTEDFLKEVELVASLNDLEEDYVAPIDTPTLDIGYESSKPVISGGNAPNLKATVPTAPSVTATVLGENDVVLKQSNIRIFEEELPQVEEEEEYDEISIPSPSELKSLTKSGILKEGDKLGFKLTGTKTQMIQQFTEQTELFIAQLQEDGDFLSASDTDEGVEDDGDENNRDGGYF